MKKLITLVFTFSFGISLFAQLSPTGLYFDGGDVVTDENFWQVHPPFGTGDFTIEAWIRDEAPVTGGYGEVHTIIVTGDIGLNDGFLVYVGNGKLAAEAAGGYLFGAGPELRDSACHHIAVVKSSGYLHGYVDGIFVSITNAFDTFTTTQPIQIGNVLPYGGNGFTGLIKEVRLWNVARTQAQIQNNMNTVLSTFESNLIGYWRCNEGVSWVLNNFNGNTTAVFGNSAFGGGNPDWSCGCPFGCLAPAGPYSVYYITSNSAQLNWYTNNCAVGYKIRYKQAGTSTWIAKSVNGNIGYKNISGLLPNTHYVWKVRSKCSSNPIIYSPWSPNVPFYTAVRLEDPIEEEITLSIYPNPATDQLIIETNQVVEYIIIQNTLGQTVLAQNRLTADWRLKTEIDVSTLPAGIYLLTAFINQQQVTKMFVKE